MLAARACAPSLAKHTESVSQANLGQCDNMCFNFNVPLLQIAYGVSVTQILEPQDSPSSRWLRVWHRDNVKTAVIDSLHVSGNIPHSMCMCICMYSNKERKAVDLPRDSFLHQPCNIYCWGIVSSHKKFHYFYVGFSKTSTDVTYLVNFYHQQLRISLLLKFKLLFEPI